MSDVEGPRRASLAQGRSRRTRREIIHAALSLWTARGFERGIEETTIDEICREAGVTKGTFYFHFAHKEDVLLELGWGTTESLQAEVEKWVADDLPFLEVIDDVLASWRRRVEEAPKALVLRIMSEYVRQPWDEQERRDKTFRQVFARAVEHGMNRGDLAEELDTDAAAAVLAAVTIDTLITWAADGDLDLLEVLRRRVGVALRGIAPSPV